MTVAIESVELAIDAASRRESVTERFNAHAVKQITLSVYLGTTIHLHQPENSY